MDNLSLNISTVNGTGSLSANQLLTKILFRSDWAVGSYNFFPSNIAGLPCLYNIRLNAKGYTGFFGKADILLSLNPKSFYDDLNELQPKGLLISDEKDHFDNKLKQHINKPLFEGLHWALPIRKSLRGIADLTPKHRILFTNIIYVGLFCEWLKIQKEVIQKTVEDFFQVTKATSLVQQNLEAVSIGCKLACEYSFPFSLPQKRQLPNNYESSKKSQSETEKEQKKTKILIDGNTSMALGALHAGCQFLSWYPITPATSLAETFEKFANTYQKDGEGKKKFLILQSEDELAGITQAIGAGWAGLRAMTVTSGPGLSLMSEGAGLSYFSEIPVVLCNIQRAGPSTGLPTRTQQADILSSCFLSHGDTKHIVLFPGTPKEAFDFMIKAFNLAEELQTLVIVLSDLDLGMNLKISDTFDIQDSPLKRGKVLREEDLEQGDFLPYQDTKGDGISHRTLPGIRHTKGAYFNRGSGHNQKARYSERPQDYSWKLDKLEKKWQTAKTMMPEPVIESLKDRKIAFVTFGSNEQSVKELRSDLEQEGIYTNFMRICSFPFPKSTEKFLEDQSEIYVVEQNRQAQFKQLLSGIFPKQGVKMRSILQYDGRPLMTIHIKKQFYKWHSK